MMDPIAEQGSVDQANVEQATVEQQDLSSAGTGVVDDNVVESTSKPVVGMTFKTWVEIETLYKRYGK